VNLQAMTAEKRKETEFEDVWGLKMVCHADVLNYRGANLFQMARGYIPIELRCDGKTVCEFEYYLRMHDMNCSIMHDIRLEIPFDKVSPGKHRFTLVNKHTELPLLVHRILFRPRVQRHLEMSLPRWAKVGDEIVLGLRILEPDTPIRIEYDSFVARTEIPDILQAGYHEIRLVPKEPVCHARIVCRDLKTGVTSQGEVEAIYDLPSENPEVKVGFDMTVVPHDGASIARVIIFMRWRWEDMRMAFFPKLLINITMLQAGMKRVIRFMQMSRTMNPTR
jgi:hypothetical protein